MGLPNKILGTHRSIQAHQYSHIALYHETLNNEIHEDCKGHLYISKKESLVSYNSNSVKYSTVYYSKLCLVVNM